MKTNFLTTGVYYTVSTFAPVPFVPIQLDILTIDVANTFYAVASSKVAYSIKDRMSIDPSVSASGDLQSPRSKSHALTQIKAVKFFFTFIGIFFISAGLLENLQSDPLPRASFLAFPQS